MSQENVELIFQRFYQRHFATGEPPWEIVDEEGELYDHDAQAQDGRISGARGGSTLRLPPGTRPGRSGASSWRS